jgi:hypothetical protein
VQITAIEIYQVDLPLHEGSYRWSGGKSVSVFDSTVVRIETHLAHSTNETFRFTSTDFNSYVTVNLAQGAPQRADGRMSASTAPGLGLRPRRDVLGAPVLTVGRAAKE